MHPRFHLCGLRDQVWVADLIEPVADLTVSDRDIICACPCSKSDIKLWRDLMPALARCIATSSGGDLLSIPEMPLDVLDEPEQISKEYLRSLEQLHKGLVAYLWLSYRFAGVFGTRKLATHVKGLVEEKIEHVLANLNLDAAMRRAILQKKDSAMKKQRAREEAAMGQALLEQVAADVEADEVIGEEGEESVGLASESSEAEPVARPSADLTEEAPESTSINIDDLITDSLEPRREVAVASSSPDHFVGEEDVVFEEPDEVILKKPNDEHQSKYEKENVKAKSLANED
jgi:ATP-dependent RNA helicase SUPV3L1/SUV3